jgi:hypothetical protein
MKLSDAQNAAVLYLGSCLRLSSTTRACHDAGVSTGTLRALERLGLVSRGRGTDDELKYEGAPWELTRAGQAEL